ncbi:unnamed protein product [Coffea canephora]|uniref:Bidirectional sugar transporter SWEET n=1 Tax=Coffea canephora TaxID=49390 RepID=A0A068VBN4_COFCA|nr:unnamed protein product [Coffea canephora]
MSIIRHLTSILYIQFTFTRIIKMKSVQEFHPYPYLAAVLNCFFWVFYALPMVHPNSLLILIISGIGIVLELTYLAIFFYFSLIVFFGLTGEAVFAAAIVLVTLLAFQTTETRFFFIGFVFVVFGLILYTSPLSIVGQVIMTKNVECMPFWICVPNFSNGTVWFIYALLPLDPFVLVNLNFHHARISSLTPNKK